MARQLYDYWFVQFDFPDENGKPYKSAGGKMVWNEKLKKKIPFGWDAPMLKSILIEEQLIQINPYVQPDKVYKHLSFPSYDACGSYYEEKGECIRSNKTVVKSDYVLASKLNPWIKRIVWGLDEENLICSTEFVVLCPNNKTIKPYLFELVNQASFIDYCTTSSTGTSHSQRRVKPDIMKLYQFPYNEEIAVAFSKVLMPMIEKTITSIDQLRTLAKQRDELLPLMMNGQVSVRLLNNHFAEWDSVLSSAFSKSKMYERRINPKNRGRDERFPQRRSDGAAARGY